MKQHARPFLASILVLLVALSSLGYVAPGPQGPGKAPPYPITDVTGLSSALTARTLGPASSTDNAIPRFDGTTGKTLQGSGILIDDANALVLPNLGSAPANPAASSFKLYYRGGTLYQLTSGGTETAVISGGGGGGTYTADGLGLELNAAEFGLELDGSTLTKGANGLKVSDATLAAKANLVSPSFTTPALGVATATKLNKYTLTTPATGATLTIDDGFTLHATADATVSGTNTGDQTSVTGNAGTVTTADAGGDTTTWPMVATSQTGSLAPATDAGLTYQATTNVLTAGGFSGPLTGNVTGNLTGNVTGDVTGNVSGNAGTVTAANEASDTTSFPAFFTSATGSLQPKTNANFAFDASNVRLGIGIATPTRELHLVNSSNNSPGVMWSNAASGSTSSDGTVAAINSDASFVLVNRENQPISLWTNNLERWDVLANGNLYSPSSKIGIGIDPVRELHLTNAANAPSIMWSNATTGHTNGHGVIAGLNSDGSFVFVNRENQPFGFWTNNTERVVMPAAGGLTVVSGDLTLAQDPTSALHAATKQYVDSGTVTLTNKRITPRVGTVADAATITPTGDGSDLYTVTALAQAATIAAPSGTPVNGQKLILRIKDNGTARGLTWNAIYRAGDTALPTTTVLGKTLYLGFIYNSADSKWDFVSTAGGF